MASKTSAVSDEPIEVLIALHHKFSLLDFAGPAEILSSALHDANDSTTKAFEITLVGEPQVLSEQGFIVNSQIRWKEAYERLNDFDVLVVVGGNSEEVVKNKSEPLDLITAFSKLQIEDSSRERTVISTGTGSLFLAQQGILVGLSATTHPDFITAFENLCSYAATRFLDDRTDVIEDARYVVNNLRFDIGDEDENPYIRRRSDAGRRPSNARKGSMSFKGATRRESIVRRAAMRLGGLRVVTTGAVASGLDASLYLVSILVSEESANEVARSMQLNWTKGIVVDGLDV
jgi:transcriptional regulator GlxA family with amidase domain